MAAKGSDGDAQDMATIIQQARKRAMNVALVIGKDGLSVAADPRKAPEVMWREAKKLGGGSKGGMGVCNVVGKELQVQFLTDDFPATLLKALKQKLRDEGLKFKPVFIGPDGSRIGDDEDEDGAEDPLVAQEDGIAPADGMPEDGGSAGAALREEFEGLADAIADAVATGSPVGKKVAALAGMFSSTLEKDEKKAGAVLGMLKSALDSLPTMVASAAPGTGQISGLADLEAKVDALLAEFA
ncbi:MAG: hypothetical protein KF887_13210 [Paracoccaceae bacterium]|nr:MAG: hypothetical protein KF887_13210 [Paracoccaceae bacterium]